MSLIGRHKATEHSVRQGQSLQVGRLRDFQTRNVLWDEDKNFHWKYTLHGPWSKYHCLYYMWFLYICRVVLHFYWCHFEFFILYKATITSIENIKVYVQLIFFILPWCICRLFRRSGMERKLIGGRLASSYTWWWWETLLSKYLRPSFLMKFVTNLYNFLRGDLPCLGVARHNFIWLDIARLFT